jgi:hypothetical protein
MVEAAMSQYRRFDFDPDGAMVEAEDGKYVRFDDLPSDLAAPRAEGLERERERIAMELNHYDLSDDPGYIKVATERVRAILTARPSDERVPGVYESDGGPIRNEDGH